MIAFPAPLAAAIALVCSLLTGWGVHYYMSSEYSKEKLASMEARDEYLKGYREKTKEILRGYKSTITDLSTRKPARVPCRTRPRLPPPGGGTDGAGQPATEERDLGPLLREAYGELERCDALRSQIEAGENF